MATLQAERLGKRPAPGQGGPHQISRGFTAAVTRRDQLKAKADGSVDMSPVWYGRPEPAERLIDRG